MAAVRRASPSVVAIDVVGGPAFLGGSGTVSGVVVADGLILTAWHLVVDARTLSVPLPDGHSPTVQLIASDEEHDLAVLRIRGSGLEAATLGSTTELETGQTLLALGGPQDESGPSVSSGILSATGRSVPILNPRSVDRRTIDGLLQTDAAINVSNQGGPLIDLAGQVVAISITSADSSQGIGFAVPIEAAEKVIADARAAQ